MQPIVITIQKDDEGYIRLTEKQLRDYIQKAYEAGYNERLNYYASPYRIPDDFYVSTTDNPNVTRDYVTVTCDGHKEG